MIYSSENIYNVPMQLWKTWAWFFFSGQTQLKSVSENIVQIEQTPLNDYSAHFLKYDLQSSAKK